LLPSGIAPKPRPISVHNSVAGIGHDRFSLTLLKSEENGVALSRASVHQMRLHVRRVPTRQISRESRTMKRRQKVPPLVPVACA
jgi:hypothetical protein